MVKLIILYNSFNIETQHKDSLMLIVNFDGLHLVHKKLFNFANSIKKANVISDLPTPKSGIKPALLKTSSQRHQQLIISYRGF